MKLYLCFLGIAAALPAQTFTTLLNFSGSNGSNPSGSLVQGKDGNLYGTTTAGGVYGGGSIFQATLSGGLTTLHSFIGTEQGVSPHGLMQASDGNFYGTAGGGFGTIFKITPAGTLSYLYKFSSNDGAVPNGSIMQGSDGNLYGMTQQGGTSGNGSIFKITTAGSLTTIHNFNGTDGSSPYGGLIQASDGNFYGATSNTIFSLTPAGTLTTLFTFKGSANGNTPRATLFQGSDGNLYGTTSGGGSNLGQGTVFKITLGGTLTTLYTFQGSDGSAPFAGVIQAPDGNLYGLTMGGGATSDGTVYKLTPGGSLTTVHSFGNDKNGYGPQSALILGSDGNLYGTALQPAGIGGAIFRLQLSSTVSYTCTNTTTPVITSVVSASAYGAYAYFASGSWLEIKGTNLADAADPRLSAATNPGQWTAADFSGSNAPTSLDGISVSINGKPAYVWYLSSGQLNVQAPEDTATGNFAITVTNCKATSPMFILARRALAPGFLAPSNYTANGTPYMVATFASDGAYVLNTATGASFGLNSRPAKPGDVIVAYGIGFGDVTPSILPGVIVGQSNALVAPVTISFGTTKATLSYAGLAGSFVGLYEFYITVPALADGDYQINATQNGTAVPQTMYLTVRN